MNRISANIISLILMCKMVLCFNVAIFQNQLLAQGVSVRINVDKDQYLIGEHVEVNIITSADRMTQIVWPDFSDTISEGLFLLKYHPIDTIKQPDGIFYYNKKLIVSAYNEGTYQFEPIEIYYIPSGRNNLQSISTPMITIPFIVPEIDEEKEIKGIKSILNIPFGKYDLLRSIGLVLLISVVVLFIIKYHRKRKRRIHEKQKFITDSNVDVLPWQAALNELKELRSMEVSTAKDVKRYYTFLTDILRKYLRDGMGVNAPELTTDQTIYVLQKENETKGEFIESLHSILHLADMVKFAKLIPGEKLHKKILDDAANFVVKTAPDHINSNNREVMET